MKIKNMIRYIFPNGPNELGFFRKEYMLPIALVGGFCTLLAGYEIWQLRKSLKPVNERATTLEEVYDFADTDRSGHLEDDEVLLLGKDLGVIKNFSIPTDAQKPASRDDILNEIHDFIPLDILKSYNERKFFEAESSSFNQKF